LVFAPKGAMDALFGGGGSSDSDDGSFGGAE